MPPTWRYNGIQSDLDPCVHGLPEFHGGDSNEMLTAQRLYDRLRADFLSNAHLTQDFALEGYLLNESLELRKAFDSGDDFALWESVRILISIGRTESHWAIDEYEFRIGNFRRTKDRRALVGPAAPGRKSRLLVGENTRWKAHIYLAYHIARIEGYKGDAALEVASRILEKIDSGRGRSASNLKQHLADISPSLLSTITSSTLSQILSCCCVWYSHLTTHDPLSLPRKPES